jgi:hypothetical protein
MSDPCRRCVRFEARPTAPRQTGRVRLAIVVVSVALAIVASQTRVFTGGADIVTAVAFAPFVVWTLARFHVAAFARVRFPSLSSATRASPRSILVWTALAACALGFEVFNYVELPRHAHPTVSSALTVLATHSISRGVAFFAWLALGAWIAAS